MVRVAAAPVGGKSARGWLVAGGGTQLVARSRGSELQLVAAPGPRRPLGVAGLDLAEQDGVAAPSGVGADQRDPER